MHYKKLVIVTFSVNAIGLTLNVQLQTIVWNERWSDTVAKYGWF